MIDTLLKVATRKTFALAAFPEDPYHGKGNLVGSGLKPSKKE